MIVTKPRPGFEAEYEFLAKKFSELGIEKDIAIKTAVADTKAQIAELEKSIENIAAEVNTRYQDKQDTLVKLMAQVSVEFEAPDEVIETITNEEAQILVASGEATIPAEAVIPGPITPDAPLE